MSKPASPLSHSPERPRNGCKDDQQSQHIIDECTRMLGAMRKIFLPLCFSDMHQYDSYEHSCQVFNSKKPCCWVLHHFTHASEVFDLLIPPVTNEVQIDPD